MKQLSFGAKESATSIQDIHAHQVLSFASAVPNIVDKTSVYTLPHVNQNTVGICTAADIVDMAQAHFGKVFSMKFQYVGQKEKYDGNMDEGSSNLSALKFSRNYGFLPIEFDPQGNNTDVLYEDFVNVSYTAEQFAEAANYKLSGYAVAPLDPLGFATALNSSSYGLMTRMSVGSNFYTPSWLKKDLELLRAPQPVTDGHSCKVVELQGLDNKQIRKIRNSWGGVGNPTDTDGTIWCGDGDIKYAYETQQPYITEAYVPLFAHFTFRHTFSLPIEYGQTSAEVTALQRVLVGLGFLTMPAGISFGYYGSLTANAVLAFQHSKGITTGDGKNAGPATRAALNALNG
jgi:hypothetical protein